MLSMNITAPAVLVSANATLGRAGIAGSESLALQSSLDNGITTRAHRALGSLRVSHQKTKELGGAVRHSLRYDLKQNGDMPPAFVNLVICGVDTSVGTDRAAEALITLMGILINENIATENQITSTSTTTVNLLGQIFNTQDAPLALVSTLGKVLNGEG